MNRVFFLQTSQLEELDVSLILPDASDKSGVTQQLTWDMDLSDGTNITEAAFDTNTAEAATVVPEDSDVKPTNEVSNSSFRPYYQSTYLLTSSDLLNLLHWVEEWISNDENNDIQIAKQLMKTLLRLLRNLNEQCDTLKVIRQVDKFALSRFQGSDDDIRFWTGFYSYEALILFWKHYVEKNTACINYWGSESNQPCGNQMKPGPRRKILPIDELFLVLIKLKRGSANRDLGERFGVHETHISRIIVTWIKILHTVLSKINIWMPRSKVRKHLPECFKPLYRDVRIVIDCTEIRSERPSDFEVQCATYSTYKGCNTYKALVGISPSGVPTFISELYEGSISDNEITNKSKLRDLMEPGDAIMADRGWTCANWLARKGIRLITPHFLNAKEQMSIPELVESVAIARVRIHVERCMGRIKQWLFLQQDIPLVYWNMISDIFQVCARLVLFWPPLIQDN